MSGPPASAWPVDGAVAAHDTPAIAQRKLASAFAAAGLASPDIDARFLLQGILGRDALELMRAPGEVVGAKAEDLNAAAARRLAHKPVSRILGVREFYGRTFHISPAVLDPRPDTETVVEAALDYVGRMGWRDKAIRIADIGTGSGAILVTLLCELPLASGIATDVSGQALEVAVANAARLGVADRFTAVETSTLENVAGPFQVVVSNPPYIPTADIPGLDQDVRLYDPLLALDGGADGLAVYRKIVGELAAFSGDFGVFLEVGAGQAGDVTRLLQTAMGSRPWKLGAKADLGGQLRCVTVEIHC